MQQRLPSSTSYYTTIHLPSETELKWLFTGLKLQFLFAENGRSLGLSYHCPSPYKWLWRHHPLHEASLLITKNLFLDTAAALGRQRQEDQKFKVSLNYTASTRSAWALLHPVSKRRNLLQKLQESLDSSIATSDLSWFSISSGSSPWATIPWSRPWAGDSYTLILLFLPCPPFEACDLSSSEASLYLLSYSCVPSLHGDPAHTDLTFTTAGEYCWCCLRWTL